MTLDSSDGVVESCGGEPRSTDVEFVDEAPGDVLGAQGAGGQPEAVLEKARRVGLLRACQLAFAPSRVRGKRRSRCDSISSWTSANEAVASITG